MPALAIFGISVGLGFVVWGIIAGQYLWPALRSLPRARALRPLLLLHSFRFIGLAFLVPGVVLPTLPDAFARPAAYGDLIAAVLALLALAGLRSRLGIGLVWCSTFGGVWICSTLFIKALSVPGSTQDSWVPLTSFRPPWYRCSLSRTGLCSGS
jgi:hypothetical protein